MFGFLYIPLVLQFLLVWKYWKIPKNKEIWKTMLLATVLLSIPGIWRDFPIFLPIELLLIWYWGERAKVWGSQIWNFKTLGLLMLVMGFTGIGRFLEFYWMDSRGGIRVQEEEGELSLFRANNGKAMDEGLKVFHFAAPDCTGEGLYLGASNNSILEYRRFSDGVTVAKHLPEKGRAGSIIYLDCERGLIFYTDFLNKSLWVADSENLKPLWQSPKFKDKITYILGDSKNQEIYLNHEFSHEVHRINYEVWPPSLEKLPLKAQAIALDPDGKWLITFWERSFNKFSLPSLKPMGSVRLYKMLKGGDVMAYIRAEKTGDRNPRTVMMSIQGVPGTIRLLDVNKMKWIWTQSVSLGTRYGLVNPKNNEIVACNFFTGKISVLDLKNGAIKRTLKGPSRCRLPFLAIDGSWITWPTKAGVLKMKQ